MPFNASMVLSSLPVIGLLLLSGCGGEPAVPTGKVTGVLTIDGEPAPEGCRVFFESSDYQDEVGLGEVDASGKFSLISRKHQDAVATGKYRVTVTGPAYDVTAFMSGTASADEMAEMKKKKEIDDMIPMRYRDPSASGLAFTVAEGENDFTVAVTTEKTAEDEFE